MRKERKILRFVPQKLRKSFANGNPKQHEFLVLSSFSTCLWLPPYHFRYAAVKSKHSLFAMQIFTVRIFALSLHDNIANKRFGFALRRELRRGG